MMEHDIATTRSPTRQILPRRRASLTQKIRVGNRRTLYLSTHAASAPLELFVRVKGHDCTAETIALYDVLARLTSVALQYGAPLETIGALLRGVKVEPAGLVTGHPTIHFCSSLPGSRSDVTPHQLGRLGARRGS